jgi:hypothetical protein
MNDRGVMALRIAHAAKLILMPVADALRVRQVGPVLEFGPRACADTMVTIACRHRLAMRGMFDELEVLDLVEHYGYAYVARPWVQAGPRKVLPCHNSAIGAGVKAPSCA